MALCTTCQGIPLESLPAAPEIHTIRLADNKELPSFSPIYSSGPAARDDTAPLGFPYHAHIEALSRSAVSCTLCAVVHTGVQEWIANYRQAEASDLWQWYRRERACAETIPAGERLWLTRRVGGAEGFIVLARDPNIKERAHLLTGVGISVEAASPLACAIPQRPLDEDSGSRRSFEVTSRWLRDCVEHHDACRPRDPSLPSRVLDVRGADDIRLVECEEGLSGKYACLSHCWGSSASFTTTRETLAARRGGIRLSDLPKTFADAVTLCRRHEIPSLWIDSLCICQNDHNDWALESSRMASVYSNAHLVIAATHARDSSKGCFHNRPARLCSRVTLPRYRGLPQAVVFVTLLRPSLEAPEWSEDRGRSFADEPLGQRGWCLQERVLACRTLHFSSRQMYFECSAGIVGEDGSREGERYCDLGAALSRPPAGCSSPASEEQRREALLKRWHDLLWAYGRRRLTRRTDKLPAMSGLARLFEQMLGSTYIAGLWGHALIEGLTWTGLDGGRRLSRSSSGGGAYVGPSWSWASFDGVPTTSVGPSWERIARVEDWHVSLRNPANRYGAPAEAWLRLWAPVARLRPEEDAEPTQYGRDRVQLGLAPPLRAHLSHPAAPAGLVDLYLDDDDSARTGEWREWELDVVFLGGYRPPRAAARRQQPGAQGDWGRVRGLVIRTVWDGQLGEQRVRVGWMDIHGEASSRIVQDETSWRSVILV